MTAMLPIAVIGAGPAGLVAATVLAAQLPGRVVVFDREATAGGIPRHCFHTGYGWRDRHRVMSGPAYARTLVAAARQAGADIQTSSMVTDWAGERAVWVTSPSGRRRVEAAAIVLATGARERPRAARWIAGDRPAGVFTTGELQQAIHLEHQAVGRRAVVVGSALVAWSAVLTLRGAGVKTVAMVTPGSRPEAYAALAYPGSLVLATPLVRQARVVRVIGRGRVSGVEVEHVASGRREVIACDTVVFTGDWIPDNELVRQAGIDLDPASLGPRVDAGLATDHPAVFAAGNLIHPVDTADVAALDGAHVAQSVLAYLSQTPGVRASVVPVPVDRAAVDQVPVDMAAVDRASVEPAPDDMAAGSGGPADLVEPAETSGNPDQACRIVADESFGWVTPSLWRPDGRVAPRGHLLAWPRRYVPRPTVVATQAGQVIGRARVPWPAAPGRVFRAPWALLAQADPANGPISLGLT